MPTIRQTTQQNASVTETSRALQHFTNRKGSIRRFAEYLHNEPARQQILYFHGDGGNGESSLLRYLRQRCAKRLDADAWAYVQAFDEVQRFLREAKPEPAGCTAMNQTSITNKPDAVVVDANVLIAISAGELDKSAKVALDQIKLKKYHQAYWEKGKKVIGLGVNFSSETKNIEDWVAEELG